MSFISGVAELFNGKKKETHVVPPPAQTLEQKRQELADYQSIMGSPAGRDFRAPGTDTLDRSKIEALQNEIREMESRQATPPPPQAAPLETPPGITQIPVVQETEEAPVITTVEEPKVA